MGWLNAGMSVPWGDIISNVIAAFALLLSIFVYLRQRKDEQERMRVRLRVDIYSFMPDPNGSRFAVIKCVNLKDFDVPIEAVWLEQDGRMAAPSTALRNRQLISGTIPARDSGHAIIEQSAVLDNRIDPYKPAVGVVYPQIGGRFESEPTVLGKRKTGRLEDILIRPEDEWPSLPPQSISRGKRRRSPDS
jgi:hypothetical protein